ncbi:RNA polymerase sigma-70 factor [Marinifilum sp. N1E240]|uniref:RNA polymerase sigma-70 factor n=1 Tax=Marinifilum sp. N1E240 TaxID=2608082 RepID=UPI00128E06ED|nr:RNA polymerase sigma-70 factor [Marinifilum sp. N1E240]MPQ46785.1 RNA polymerase sigma-70 factor [Marinifilum sp. N1E240]
MLEDTNTILHRIRKGDLNEFEKVFKQYYPMLCHYALKFVKDSSQAEEIVQELFCKLWEDRQKLNIHTSLKSYLYRATYLNSLQHLRKKGLKNQYKEYVKNSSSNNFQNNQLIEEKEIQSIIQNTLSNLPERCGKIFKMSRFEGLKYQEIADKLSISIKTVESNMGKALKAFRKNLKDYVSIIVL